MFRLKTLLVFASVISLLFVGSLLPASLADGGRVGARPASAGKETARLAGMPRLTQDTGVGSI